MIRRRTSLIRLIPTVMLCAGSVSWGQTPATSRVQAIRFWSFGDVTRVAIQTQGDYKLDSDQIENPSRIYFDLNGLLPPAARHRGIQTIRIADRRVKQIRIAEVSPGRTRVVFDLEGPAEVVSSQLVNPDRLMIEIRPKGTSLPGLNMAHSVTGSQQVDLSAADNTNTASLDNLTAPAVPSPTSNVSSSPVQRTLAALPDPPASSAPSANASRAHNDSPAPRAITTLQTRDGFVVQQTTVAKNLSPSTASIAPLTAPAVYPRLSTAPIPVPAVKTTVAPSLPAGRDSVGDRSLVRVFGLKMGKVVIDAGHGGHDTGTIGPGGLMEKDLVLDVATRLGKLITQQLGAEVVYTRSDDTFIPLEERTKIANNERADLFISIHANSSPEPSATGVETYYFNLTSDKSGLDLATRENATSASSISDLNDLLHKAVLQAKLEESREFAQRVQTSLWAGSVKMNNRSRDRGVRQAPFVVLIGATMPSILAEIGFVSNPHDEKLMRRGDQRQKIAEALFKGVSQYANSLSHVQMARASSQ
ncbi:MAG: N-acetylmuramoyl-L-alanine amidase [Acidobacteriaceae bacterium]|nr:N-acetylmuramoyl-L-alanine amidase [Acidobacteriaceae bacterium]